MSARIDDVSSVGRPVKSALAEQGFHTLEDLDGQPRTKLINLHGVGKAGLARLEAAMAEEGYSLAEGNAVWTHTDRGEAKAGTGENAPDVKTAPTDESPAAWVESLPWPKRVEQGRELLRIFGEATGKEPRMWGPSMVGYGEIHYQYATGSEGDMMRVGFSPRKGSLSLYGLQLYGSNQDLLDRIGKHKRGKSCVYVNKLEDIDEPVLRQLIARAWEGGGPPTHIASSPSITMPSTPNCSTRSSLSGVVALDPGRPTGEGVSSNVRSSRQGGPRMLSDEVVRWMYRGGRPNRLARLMNGLGARMSAMGVGPARMQTLEVTGRRSGRTVAFPIVVTEQGGERYLVSMLGDNTNWVRNVRAAGGRASLLHGEREAIQLDEVPVAERPGILRRFLQLAPGGRPHIPVDRRAPIEEFERIADRYPVFRITTRNAST